MTTPLSDAAKAARRELREVYERAYALFLYKLEVAPTPEHFPLSYALCEEAKETCWPSMQFAGLMVSGDLSETINQINAWREWLMHLSIWTEVIDQLDGDDAWTIQHSYVDPLAHICLTLPSAVRDRFGHVATNSIHQANLNIVSGYKDQLVQDAQPYPLGRKRTEEQLGTLGKHWPAATAFLESLQKLDAKEFREATRNYRNLASHAIAPRFRLGITNFVVRGMTPLMEKLHQPDGGYFLEPHPTRKVVSYGFGGTDALDLAKVYVLSLQEFEKAVEVFARYNKLLEAVLAALRAKPVQGSMAVER